MKPAWFSLLRCPYCRGRFRFDPSPPLPDLAEFGVLRCECSAFPVVDGTPVLQRGTIDMFEHTTGTTEVAGPAVAEVVRLIERGKPLEALVECLAVPTLPVPLAIQEKLPWRVVNSRTAQAYARWIGKRQLSRSVLARRRAISARGLFEFFYRAGLPLQVAVGHYFLLRFCQPRHLAALALLAPLPPSDKPVLDIACGVGHLSQYLTERRGPLAVVGTDMNFFQLWIARHWMAPAGQFVCTNANDGLPFQDDAFSATVCSDAYHYISKRRELQSEIQRCASERPVVLTRVGNRRVMPNEGLELSVPEYLTEFGTTAVDAFSETELLKAYLSRRNPLAEPTEPAHRLADVKWVSFAWNLSATIRDASWEEREWPHAVGQIGINPIYRTTTMTNGDSSLRFEFPHPWYAYENHEMLSYHPRTVTISQRQLDERQHWRDDPSLSSLVSSCVLVGLPRRF